VTARHSLRLPFGPTRGPVVATATAMALLAAVAVGVVPGKAFADSAIDVSPTTVDLSNVTVGQQAQRQVTVTDPSSGAQDLTSISLVPPVTGSPAPTGTVQFAIDGANLAAPATLSLRSGPAGQAPQAEATSSAVPSLDIGSHVVTATYSGDSAYQAGSATLTQTVIPVVVAAVSPAASPLGPYLGGTPVTITGAGFTGVTQVTFGGHRPPSR
jgi:Bacterial Ig-like domain (group 3)